MASIFQSAQETVKFQEEVRRRVEGERRFAEAMRSAEDATKENAAPTSKTSAGPAKEMPRLPAWNPVGRLSDDIPASLRFGSPRTDKQLPRSPTELPPLTSPVHIVPLRISPSRLPRPTRPHGSEVPNYATFEVEPLQIRGRFAPRCPANVSPLTERVREPLEEESRTSSVESWIADVTMQTQPFTAPNSSIPRSPLSPTARAHRFAASASSIAQRIQLRSPPEPPPDAAAASGDENHQIASRTSSLLSRLLKRPPARRIVSSRRTSHEENEASGAKDKGKARQEASPASALRESLPRPHPSAPNSSPAESSSSGALYMATTRLSNRPGQARGSPPPGDTTPSDTGSCASLHVPRKRNAESLPATPQCDTPPELQSETKELTPEVLVRRKNRFARRPRGIRFKDEGKDAGQSGPSSG